MQIPVTAACAGICGLLIFLLAMRVSMLRLGLRVALGDGGHPELTRAIRAHANTIEFVPIYLLMSLCYELYAGANWALISLNLLFLLGRLSLALGLSLAPLHPTRRLGAVLSYFTLGALAVLLLAAVTTAF